VADGDIEIVYIKSGLQIADLLTKALIVSLFIRLRTTIMGWVGSLNRFAQRECSDKQVRTETTETKTISNKSKRLKE
jgi:hypothetical protein